jgi:hypothetical protein
MTRGRILIHYWEKYTKDHLYDEIVSTGSLNEKYLLWAPWWAGFNNHRLSFEVGVMLAWLTNRTFVFPPQCSTQRHQLNSRKIIDWYDKRDLSKMIRFISYDIFSERFGLKNITESLCGFHGKSSYLEDLSNNENLKSRVHIIWKDKSPTWSETITGVYCVPAPCNETNERFKNFRSPTQRNLVNQSDVIWKKDIVALDPQLAMIPVWYIFYYFKDPIEEEKAKNVMRDHLHIKEELFMVADKLLNILPKSFSALHLRRGAWFLVQQSDIIRTGPRIYENVKNLLKEDEILYIATDEKNMTYLHDELLYPFNKSNHRIFLLNDIKHQINSTYTTNYEWIGILETLILCHARVFIGTELSTFTNHIHRLRLLMNAKHTDKEMYFINLHFPSNYTKKVPLPIWSSPFAIWKRETKNVLPEYGWERDLSNFTWIPKQIHIK